MRPIEVLEKNESKKLYQWDTERYVLITAPESVEVDAVDFAHEKDPQAIRKKIVTEDGLQVAKIPNKLLQSKEKIRAWLMCGEQTVCASVLVVIAKAKSPDYILPDDEDEVRSYITLEKRIEDLEKNGSCAGATNAVQYVEQKLTEEQQKQARENIGAVSAEDVREFSDIKAEEIADGVIITIKDKDGTKTVAVKNGKDGKDGKTPHIDEDGYVVCGHPIPDEKANSLWALMQKIIFSSQPTDEELNAFRTAWGLVEKCLYPLANGTHTFTDGTIVEVTNGNHVAISFGSNTGNATIVASDINENDEELGVYNAYYPPSTWFALKSNDIINIEYSNFVLKTSATNIAIGYKQTGTSNTVSGLSSTYPVVSYTHTIESDANIGNLFLFIAEAKAGDTIEFDVSIIVNGIKYV